MSMFYSFKLCSLFPHRMHSWELSFQEMIQIQANIWELSRMQALTDWALKWLIGYVR